MWNYISPQDIFEKLRVTALEQLDEQIAADHANGHTKSCDEALDRRLYLMSLPTPQDDDA